MLNMEIASVYAGKRMAPQVGLEPTTLRLTAGCSAIELLRSVGKGGDRSRYGSHHIILVMKTKGPGWRRAIQCTPLLLRKSA
jgi:hypothetical protein